MRSSRWIPVESHETQLREVHNDHFGTVIPEDGVECAFEQRCRREIELTARRQAVNSTLARLLYR